LVLQDVTHLRVGLAESCFVFLSHKDGRVNGGLKQNQGFVDAFLKEYGRAQIDVGTNGKKPFLLKQGSKHAFCVGKLSPLQALAAPLHGGVDAVAPVELTTASGGTQDFTIALVPAAWRFPMHHLTFFGTIASVAAFGTFV
jgi:hypothetical protein